MRILIIGMNYAPELTGIAPYTSALASGLAKRGHSVHVKTTHPHYPEWKIRSGYGKWTQREIIDSVKVERLRHFVPRRPSSAKRLFSEITFGVRAAVSNWERPDFVIFTSPALFSSFVAASRLWATAHRLPYIVWVQDFYGLGIIETGAGGGRIANLVSSVESRLLKSASGVAVIHQRFASHVAKNLDVDMSSIQVIRNWTHVQSAVATARDATRQRLGWKPDQIIALHAGNMGVKQGLENLVESARLADSNRDNLLFVLMGDGNQRESVEQLAAGVERVQFIDPLPSDEFQNALAAADVLLVNERSGLAEMAVPSKLTSYFSTGLPVVAATDEGSITAEEIETSKAGIRVPASDPSKLLAAIRELGTNRELARKLGQNGLAFRDRILTENAAIASFEKWILSLIDSRN